MGENGDNKLDRILPALCLILALATVALVYFLNPGAKPLYRLTIVVGYILVILVFFFGLIVLIAMATNRIDLSGLLCEPTENKASMSRFQLLIFTFVITFSLVLIILAGDPPTFPDVPSSILMLLGISASTYAVSKGIQAGKDGDGDGAEAKRNAAEAKKAAPEARGHADAANSAAGKAETQATTAQAATNKTQNPPPAQQ